MDDVSIHLCFEETLEVWGRLLHSQPTYSHKANGRESQRKAFGIHSFYLYSPYETKSHSFHFQSTYSSFPEGNTHEPNIKNCLPTTPEEHHIESFSRVTCLHVVSSSFGGFRGGPLFSGLQRPAWSNGGRARVSCGHHWARTTRLGGERFR